MEGGYIKLYTSLLKWEWYDDINTCRLFLHMLLRANWKDAKFQGTTVPRGSFVSSLQKLSDETKLTVREVRTAISHLKTTGEVTSRTTNKFTVFTVVKYDMFQSGDKQGSNRATGGRQSNDKRTTTIEEYTERKDMKDIKDQSIICSSQEIVSSIPLKDGSEYGVTSADVDEFKAAYPLVNVSQELRVMRAWSNSNPQKRKTRRGIRRFINSWLSREQKRLEEREAVRSSRDRELEDWVNGTD